MSVTDKITLFHAPNSRSTGALILLEELGAPFDLHVLNLRLNEQRQPDYLAINPMGKVPAIRHGDALVTEQVAVYIYLADLFPEAKLAPPLTDKRRGPYLRWLAFYGSCFEPAMVDRGMKRDPAPAMMSPYGDVDTVVTTLTRQLEAGPYILGEDLCSADILWGTALQWMTGFGLIAASPVITAYVDRISARPAVARAKEKDAQIAERQNAS